MSQPADGVERAKRRLGYYLLVVAVAILGFTLLYRAGMAAFEGQQVSYVKALEVVVQSFTTTGFGEDAATWSTPAMWLLAVAMMLTGVSLVFLALPLFLVPLVEASLRAEPPGATDLTDHVIIASFTARGDRLVDELASRDTPYVVVEPDRQVATDLHRDGYDVVHGDPEEVATLEAANAEEALALVADADDETNASVVLSAKQAAPDLRVITLVEDTRVADYHRYAGADEVVSPRRLLGRSLANKASNAVTTDLGGAIEVGEDFEIAELLVQVDSTLVGRTIAESGIGETGANIIGAWFEGEFVSPPSPDAVIDEHTVLLVAGREAELERLKQLTLSETRRHRRGSVVVAGYGEVGATVADELAGAEVTTTVVALEDEPGVDVAGDVTERQTLEEADIDAARSLVLAVDDDTTAVFAALAVKQVAPDVEIIARANRTESVPKLYRAGADYVLALATVSGRILASNLLDEEVIAPDTQVEVIRTEAAGLVGSSLAEADVRARTNCTVIAIERDGDLLTDVQPDLVVREGDDLVVAGTDEDINRFNELLT